MKARWALRIAVVALLAGFTTAELPAGQAPAAPPHLSDHGTFEIFAAGKSIGTETFEIRVRKDQIEAQGNVQLQVEQNGKTVEVRTTSNLLLDPQLDPLSYTWSQKGTQSSQLSIDFRAQPAHVRYKTVRGQDDQRDFHLEKDVVVLDDNVFHQYQLAVARYDAAKAGQQVFRAFIPQEALPGTITLNSLGADQVRVEEKTLTLRHFLLSTELAQINLWVDDQGHLQKVSTPDSQFQVMRKK